VLSAKVSGWFDVELLLLSCDSRQRSGG